MAKLITLFATDAPPAAEDFFRRNPHQRTPFALETGPILPPVLARVQKVNQQLNRYIAFRDDLPGKDRWYELTFPAKIIAEILAGADRSLPEDARVGDCEEHALVKRAAFAPIFGYGCLAPLVLRLSSGRGHMVLAIRTTSETWILDNLQDRVIPLLPAHNPQMVYAGGRWLSCTVQEPEVDGREVSDHRAER